MLSIEITFDLSYTHCCILFCRDIWAHSYTLMYKDRPEKFKNEKCWINAKHIVAINPGALW